MKRYVAYAAGAAAAIAAVAFIRRRQFSFENKTILITGGSRGLGLVLARQICAEGGRVALVARNEAELERACSELRQLGGEAFPLVCDLQVREETEAAVQRVIDHYGSVDVLINNAGIIEVGPLEHMSRADFEKAMQIHLWAPFALMMEVIPHMRQRGGGRIVNITSIGGKIAVPHMAAYCASKFALVGLSDALRSELAKDHIHVTTVTPGMMRTGSHVNAKFKGQHAAEFAWFATSNAMPFISMKAERAAAKILNACRTGRLEITLTLAARAAIAGNAVFPSITGHAMKLANQMLPGPTDSSGDRVRSGRSSRSLRLSPAWLTYLADRATGRNNEASATS